MVKTYPEYILEHLQNITRAYTEFGEELCKRLLIDSDSLLELVELHDKSKYSRQEFIPYQNRFYPSKNCTLDKEQIENDFQFAWLHHIHNNKHHPEYWTYAESPTEIVILDMPPIYIAEMLLDHQAMSYKFGGNAYDYYQKTKDSKPYSKKTKEIIESVIDIFNK